jgi:hypothetical protein
MADDMDAFVWLWNDYEANWHYCRRAAAETIKTTWPKQYGEIVGADMSTLPYDIARCMGVSGADACEYCRRKEPGRAEQQVYIAPEWTEASGCPKAIQPRPPVMEAVTC